MEALVIHKWLSCSGTKALGEQQLKLQKTWSHTQEESVAVEDELHGLELQLRQHQPMVCDFSPTG